MWQDIVQRRRRGRLVRREEGTVRGPQQEQRRQAGLRATSRNLHEPGLAWLSRLLLDAHAIAACPVTGEMRPRGRYAGRETTT